MKKSCGISWFFDKTPRLGLPTEADKAKP
jgi:hypothetical protein